VLPGASSIALTSDIWSGNSKEDYISVVAHYVSADWELQKKVIDLRLIEVKYIGENIAEKVACVVQEFGLLIRSSLLLLTMLLPMLESWKL
jgi:hypothetical protein